MNELIDALALLRGTGSSDEKPLPLRPCFCQGSKHLRHPFAPICTSCGLLLCTIVSPSPLLGRRAPCPSCGEPMLDEQSRGMLAAQLDAQLAKTMADEDERAARVRQERQVGRANRRTEADLFPQLAGMAQGGSTSSDAAADYKYFNQRRRQIDIAMGRRIDDTQDSEEKRVRVLRIGAKPAAGKKKTSKAKKSDKDKEAKKAAPVNGAAPSSPALSSARVDVEGEASSAAHSEAASEEGVEDHVPFDREDDALAPVSDPHDDGFRDRWAASTGSRSHARPKTSSMSTEWTPRDKSRTFYVPPEDRPAGRPNTGGWPAPQEEQDLDTVDSAVAAATVRHVPGSSQAVKAR